MILITSSFTSAYSIASGGVSLATPPTPPINHLNLPLPLPIGIKICMTATLVWNIISPQRTSSHLHPGTADLPPCHPTRPQILKDPIPFHGYALYHMFVNQIYPRTSSPRSLHSHNYLASLHSNLAEKPRPLLTTILSHLLLKPSLLSFSVAWSNTLSPRKLSMNWMLKPENQS